ncbi:hypothetical protein ABVT39_026980 [Epinephelus coioides]
MLPCRLKASDRGETTERVHEWKRRNAVHISRLKWEVNRATYHGSHRQRTFLMFFSRSSTRQHDYSTGTERENAQRHRYKMKPDRQYSAAS